MLERLQKLCDERGITFTYLERELGFSKSSMRRWDTNAPSVDKLQKVADYFGCTTDYLLGRTSQPNYVRYELPEEYTLEGKKLAVNIVEDAIKEGLTPEDFEHIVDMIKNIKQNKA